MQNYVNLNGEKCIKFAYEIYFQHPNSNELSATRQTVLADDGKVRYEVIPVTPGRLPGQRHWDNCMAVGTTSLSACGAYRLSPDCVRTQSGNLFSIFLALYAFLRQYIFYFNRPIVRYCNLHAKLYWVHLKIIIIIIMIKVKYKW